ncbi:Ankyrin repeat domain containing protein [Pandoravirus salinus]|uniref:Ankyrin repeat domain containing protein n=1 Tax=Pandoravirus salinus TaxID=1349410 RepID=S4W2D6_9VIRU|nr:ankyrin repeat domain [Pandoravirus salinus]AGO84340.1 Ankyrin repeat domain containing protein [Pandoravirus salinus]
MQDGPDSAICGEPAAPNFGAGASDEPPKSINEVLPVEIIHMVLTHHLDDRYDWVYARTVCVLWASLLPVVKKNVWHDNGFFASRAATAGHLSLLQWARTRGIPWKCSITCSCAAAHGHLSVLEWLRTEGCPWNRWTCSWAAEKGQLEVLQWARAQDCPWNGDTCQFAAGEGHLRVLQWAVANGCTWEADACRRAAAESNHDHIVAWIDTHTASTAPGSTLKADA